MVKRLQFVENTEGVTFDEEGMSYCLKREGQEDFIIRAGISAQVCLKEKLHPVTVINIVPGHGRIPCVEVKKKKGGEIVTSGCGALYPEDYKI